MSFYLQLLQGLLLTLSMEALSVAATDSPNIVIIVADDMGFNDVGFHGGDVRTPNLDALASQGVILNRHYAQASCTPSRAALMTGRYPFRAGIQTKPLPAGYSPGLSLNEKLFPQYFRELGYKSHLVGKWHLGYETRAHMPISRGFDSFFGYLNGLLGYYDFTHTQSGYTGRDFRRNNDPYWTEVYGHYLTDVLTEEAVKVIADHDDYGGLLLFLQHAAPHTGNLNFLREAPVSVRINSTDREIFAEMVRCLDDSVGKVVTALERKGVLNNSIIVFMSDNGAPTHDPLWGYTNHGSNWPFRGEKMSLHEGGVRTAALVWSSMFKKPFVSPHLFHITDWLPTLYTAAGGVLINNIDGIDQWSSLKSDGSEGARREVLQGIDSDYQTEAIIKGKWKLVKDYNPTSDQQHTDKYYGESGRNSTYDPVDVTISPVGKILRVPTEDVLQARKLATLNAECENKESALAADCHSKHCLYSLEDDLAECVDRSAEYPAVVAELRAALEVYKSAMVSRNNMTFDPRSDPTKWDDFWSPWLDTEEPSSANVLFVSWTCLVFTLFYV